MTFDEYKKTLIQIKDSNAPADAILKMEYLYKQECLQNHSKTILKGFKIKTFKMMNEVNDLDDTLKLIIIFFNENN